MKKIHLITVGLVAATLALPLAAFAGHHEDGEKKMAGIATPDALAAAFVVAVEAEDADALAALYTEDGDSYGPGGGDRVTGHAAIKEGWTHFFGGFDNFSASLDKHGSIDFGDNGHSAWGMWTMSATPAAGGDPVTWKGRFLDVQVKTEHGWRYRVDHASMYTPPAAEAADEE